LIWLVSVVGVVGILFVVVFVVCEWGGGLLGPMEGEPVVGEPRVGDCIGGGWLGVFSSVSVSRSNIGCFTVLGDLCVSVLSSSRLCLGVLFGFIWGSLFVLPCVEFIVVLPRVLLLGVLVSVLSFSLSSSSITNELDVVISVLLFPLVSVRFALNVFRLNTEKLVSFSSS
jgi:hypothetical protein